MGKTQSKRSVDITTDPKKGPEEEVTGKMEKIEDVDQKEVNGDATIPEKNEAEKKDAEECENDKDLTTEKSTGDAIKGGGDAADPNNTTATGNDGETPKDEAAAGKEGATAVEEISPLADESIKKTKKDKVKKKWSFRSISFGKKDKQKPVKTEETAEAAAATTSNGDAEKTPTDGEAAEAPKKEEGAGGDAESKPTENGESSKTEQLNGEKTPTDIKSNETVETTNTVPTPAEATTGNDIQTETNAANVDTNTATTNTVSTPPAEVVSNGTVDDTAKNGVATDAEADDAAVINKAPESAEESNNSIPNIEEKPHQNGTNGEENNDVDDEQQLKSTIKSQIEVNNIATNINNPTMNIVDASADKILETISQIPIIDTTIAQPIEISSSSDSHTDPQIQTVGLKEVEEVVQNELELVTTSTNNPVNTSPIPTESCIEKGINETPLNSNTSTTTTPINETVPVNNTEVVDLSSTVQTNDQTVESSSQENNSADMQFVEENIEKQTCSETQLPPPLPISPPPSQVSVFAFKNTETIAADNLVVDAPLQPTIEVEAMHTDELSSPTAEAELAKEHDLPSNTEVVVVNVNSETADAPQTEEAIDAEIQSNILLETESCAAVVIESETSNISKEIEAESESQESAPIESEQLNVIKENEIIETSIPIDFEAETREEIIEIDNEKCIAEVSSIEQTDLEPEPSIKTDEMQNEKNAEVLDTSTSAQELKVNENPCKNDAAIIEAIVDEITEKAAEIALEKQQQDINDEVNTEIKENMQEIETEKNDNSTFENDIKESNSSNKEVEINEPIPCIEDFQNSTPPIVSLAKDDTISLEGETNLIELPTNQNKLEVDLNNTPDTTATTLNADITNIENDLLKIKKDVDVDAVNEMSEQQLSENDKTDITSNIATSPVTKSDEISKEIEENLIISMKEEGQTQLNAESEDTNRNEKVEDEKEINPKDLKEISAAEITTQKDLPVTCE